MANYTDAIRTFIESEMTGPNVKLSASDSLIDMGIVDSLGVQRLIAYLEREFDLRIADTEIVPENFETIDSVVRFVNAKLDAQG